MAQKRFGPTLGAGTVVIEKESEKTISASALGSTAYVGILERGEVGEVIKCTGKRDLLAKTGGYIPDSLLPDNARHFWERGEGAGILFLYRVTDGNEVKATLPLYDRKSPRNKVVTFEAKNGGGWGGRRQTWIVDLDDVSTDIAETTVDLPIAFSVKKDQLKGGTLTLSGANSGAGGTWEIIGNDASDGTTKTEVRLATDSEADTEFGSATDKETILEVGQVDVWGRDKQLAVVIKDGQVNPSTEWGCEVYLDGDLVLSYPDLSSDPNSERYFVELINRDGSNHYVSVTDHWTGAITAAVRPANFYGTVADTDVSALELDTADQSLIVDTSLAGANTIGAFTFGAQVIPDVYTFTYNTGVWDVVSLNQQAEHAFPTATGGTPYVADNPYSIGFTITESGPSNGEKFTVTVLPMVEDEAIDGKIFFPGVTGAPAGGWDISDNDETKVNISTGDLTIGATIPASVPFRLEYKQEMRFGYDGIAEIDNNDLLPAYSVSSSPFNDLDRKGYGLIKFATPGVTTLSGVTATVIEKAGVAYTQAKNHQYRYEIPENITDEFAAKEYVQETLGKNDYSKVIFPSWCSVSDPILSGRLKDVPTTGMVHGREAKSARDWNGYHKAAAGIDMTLPDIVEIPTLERTINGEILNPAGIQQIDIRGGNFVIWGDRVPFTDPAFKFAHQRELLSYYEHVLAESFDYVIFAINDSQEWPGLLAALASFFRPEWRKRAIRGSNFKEAAQFKIDAENNTDLTMAAGDLNAEIKLKLADTIERFIIQISKAGITEDSA